MDAARIRAIGVALPQHEYSTEQVLERLQSDGTFEVERITGIRSRRMVDRQVENTLTLGAEAAAKCLAKSGYRPADVDVVISAGTTVHDGYHMVFEPASAHGIARRIGAYQATGYDIANACGGTLTGIYLLESMIRAGIVRSGLVVTSEIISPVTEGALAEAKGLTDLQFAALTLGDAAVAVLLDRAVDDHDRIHYVEMVTLSEYSPLCIAKPSDDTENMIMLTDNLTMQAAPRRETLGHLLHDVSARAGATVAEEKFDFVVFHQLAVGYTEKLAASCAKINNTELPPRLVAVDKYGNTGASSHFLVINDYIERGEIPRGAKLCVMPVASGIVGGVMSVTLDAAVA